jgi:hypothetical protein
MSHSVITWRGREISCDDWDTDRTGYLVFNAERIDWDGTADGLTVSLVNYLDALPNENGLGWPKTTIEKLCLSGDLSENGKPRKMAVFPVRRYGGSV